MIRGLDGLRGMAVLFVIFSHIDLWARIGFDNNFTKIMMTGEFGVRLFFCLSGFLITHLILSEYEKNGKFNIRNFWMRRILRLMPLYYFAITFTLIVEISGQMDVQNCAYLYAYTHTYNFVPSGCRWQGFNHFWSLAVEEHFYLIWSILFLLGVRYTLASIVALITFFIFFPSLDFIFGSVQGMARWTYPAMLPIAVGCLGAFFIRLRYITTNMRTFEFSGLFLIASVALIFLPWLGPRVDYSLQVLLQSFGVTFLMVHIYYNQESNLVKVLSWKPLVALGIISYGLYVWQGVFTGNGIKRNFDWPPSVDVGVFLTFFIAPISYWYLERPFLNLKDKFRP